MIRRRISSMPVGMVIVALAVIALVAFAALFLFGGPPGGGPPSDGGAIRADGPQLAGRWLP